MPLVSRVREVAESNISLLRMCLFAGNNWAAAVGNFVKNYIRSFIKICRKNQGQNKLDKNDKTFKKKTSVQWLHQFVLLQCLVFIVMDTNIPYSSFDIHDA
jgi:polyhydroxyalkanoate synthesis regulator protein